MLKATSQFLPTLDFTWRRAIAGYRWMDTVSGRRLSAIDSNTEQTLISPERYYREYRPLIEYSGLFWKFAALDANEEAVSRFADAYGLLGASFQPQFGTELSPRTEQPESLELWKSEIDQLRQAVLIWRVVVSGDRKSRRRLKKKLSSPDAPLAVQRYLHAADEDPAMLFLGAVQRLADARLRQLVLTRLVFVGNRPRLVVVLQPQSLLGALWLQFAAAVHGSKSFAKCPHCGIPFEVSREPSGKRRSARFCSNRCRVAHYRDRIETARRMNRRGIPARGIARALNTTVATVRNWLSRR